MKESAHLVWLLIAAVGCASTEDVVDPPNVRDAGTTPDSGACVLDVPTALRVREGAIIDLAADDPNVEVTWPSGFVDLGAGRGRAPYGMIGPAEVAVQASCGTSANVRVVVAPIEFERTPAWADGDGPDAREHPTLWIDPNNADRLMLFGGFSFDPVQFTVVDDLWSYDLTTAVWTSVPSSGAPASGGGRVAVDRSTNTILYEGGAEQSNAQPFVLSSLDLATNPATWTPLTPGGAPSTGSTLHGFVFDAPRGRYLSIGGFADQGPSIDVSVFDPTAQTYASLPVVGDPPSPRYGFFVAHDEAEQRVVIFSGAQTPTAQNNVNPANDTWALELGEDPPRWVRLFDATDSPPGRRNGCAALDEANHRFFVYGGTPEGRTTEYGLWVLDLDRGAERWTRIDSDLGNGVTRSSCAGIYDGARKRVLFGFGNNTAAIYADFVAVRLD